MLILLIESERRKAAMKKTNKIIAVMIIGALALSVSSCGATQTAQNTPAPAATQQAVSETVKTGVVIEASMHNLTIEAMDGSTYSFISDDSTEVIGSSENLGDTVSVEFDGEYQEYTLAKKIQIVEKADESVSSSATEVTEAPAAAKETTEEKSSSGGAQSESKSAAPKYITGTVTDVSMNNITVEWNGRNYTILKTDKTTVEGDVIVGATVRVYHTGDIADGVEAIDISVVAPELANSDIKYITGTVVDASMNTIVIENGGHKYSVLKDDNTKSDNVAVGDTVRVYHKGSYSDGMVATSIMKQ